jgi:hypothetical protein
MRKIVNTLMAAVILSGLGVGLTGCNEESGVKETTKITRPDGSQTTETNQTKINKSGENPPPAPSEKR